MNELNKRGEVVTLLQEQSFTSSHLHAVGGGGEEEDKEAAEGQQDLAIVGPFNNAVSDPVARLKCLWVYVST